MPARAFQRILAYRSGMPVWNLIAVGLALIVSVATALFGGHAPQQREPKALADIPALESVTNSVSLPALAQQVHAVASGLAVTPSTGLALPTGISTTAPQGYSAPLPSASPASAPPAASMQTPAAVPTAPTAPAAPSAAVTASNDLNTVVGLVRGALVNIICTPKASTGLKSASATGVVIDSRGVILTVAHMAQYFLLADYGTPGDVSCIIRIGSPAEKAYTAQLAYISPDWVENNLKVLTETAPTGTGENDFALLAITGSATDAAVPASFTAIPLSSATPAKGDDVTIGSYGAEFLTSNQVRTALYPIVVFGNVGERYTFDTTSIDLIGIDNTAAAQEGSSGGAVVNKKRQLAGLITTSSSGSISGRDLHAITPGHMRRSFEESMNESMDSFIAGNAPTAMVKEFAPYAKRLATLLEAAVEK